MKGIKGIAGLLVLLVLLTALTGCAGSSKEADYMQALLDVAYGKDVRDYVKITGEDKSDVLEYQEQSLSTEAKYMADYYGLNPEDEAVVSELKVLCKELYDRAKITAKKYKSDDGNVLVEVSRQGPDVLVEAKEEIDNYLKEFDTKAYVEGDASLTQKTCAQTIVELCEKYLKGEEKDITFATPVTVEKKERSWTVSDEDVSKIDLKVICYPGVCSTP